MLTLRFSLVADVHEVAPIDGVENYAAEPSGHGSTLLGRRPFPRSVVLFFLRSEAFAIFRRWNFRHRIFA